MATIKVKGSPNQISKEELRAMVSSASLVMEFHNHKLKDNKNTIKVHLKPGKKLKGKTKTGKDVIGRAYWKGRMIELPKDMGLQKTFTVSIHEVVHLYKRFPPDTSEKCTSTLVARLKPDVAQIYNSLVKDIYKRAAYIAHTKISYTADGEDHYDSEEHKDVNLSKEGVQYR